MHAERQVSDPRTTPAVLVIESDAAISAVLLAIFERQQFKTVVVEQGPRAMRLIENGQCSTFDTIIVQCAPVASPSDPRNSMGVAFLDALAAQRPVCLRRTIIITPTPKIPPRLHHRVCRIITEPFDIDDLTDAVRRCAAWSAAT